MNNKIPTLSTAMPIVDPETGAPSAWFIQWFGNAIDQIYTNVNAVLAANNAAIAANAAAVTANTAATAASVAATAATVSATAATVSATTANTAATAVTAQANIANSYVTGATLNASDAGTNASIAISAHTRVFGDSTSVAVNAGSITGLAYSTLYYVYYDDPARVGGAVTYQATTSNTTAAQLGNRFVVGSVTTPAAAGTLSGGQVVRPPGSLGLK